MTREQELERVEYLIRRVEDMLDRSTPETREAKDIIARLLAVKPAPPAPGMVEATAVAKRLRLEATATREEPRKPHVLVGANLDGYARAMDDAARIVEEMAAAAPGGQGPKQQATALDALKWVRRQIDGRRIFTLLPAASAMLDDLQIFVDAAISRVSRGEPVSSYSETMETANGVQADGARLVDTGRHNDGSHCADAATCGRAHVYAPSGKNEWSIPAQYVTRMKP